MEGVNELFNETNGCVERREARHLCRRDPGRLCPCNKLKSALESTCSDGIIAVLPSYKGF